MIRRLAPLFALSLVAVACNLNLGPKELPAVQGVGVPGGETSEPKSILVVHVSAAEGGTVTDKTGKATLNIPAGALAADTDITLSVSAAANTAGDIYDFGPDGLHFLKPAELSLKADVAQTKGQPVAVAIEEGGVYKALEGSTFDKGIATAPVAHFTKYSLIFADGHVSLKPPSSCAEMKESFKPCGGDPKGHWTFADLCVDPRVLGQDPFEGRCPGATAEFEAKYNRSVTIDDQTIALSAGTVERLSSVKFPLQCLRDRAHSDQVTCGDLSKSLTCTTTGDSCACTGKDVNQEGENVSTYTVEGSTLVMTNDEGKVSRGDYCVSGDTMVYREIPTNDGPPVSYVLKRM